MAERFDPYHVWLGISPKEQPPDHYRLLAITRFESDPDVIEGAADRQMAHVRTFQTGKHSADSQRVLNELSAAKLCLLDPAKRAAYEADLRRRIAAAQPVTAIPKARPLISSRQAPSRASVADASDAPPIVVADSEPTSHARHRGRPRTGPAKSSWLALAAVAVPAAIFVGYLIYNKPVEQAAPQKLLPHGRGPVVEDRPLKPKPAPTTPPDGKPKRFAFEIPDPRRARWSIEGDELVQSSLCADIDIVFGEPTAEDFDFLVEVKRMQGNDACGLQFGYETKWNRCVFGLAGYGNTLHNLSSFDDNRENRLASFQGSLSNSKWHKLDLKIRGNRGQGFLDGEQILTCTFDRRKKGRFGFYTWDSAYRFRNILVKSPDGKILLRGLPDLDAEPPAADDRTRLVARDGAFPTAPDGRPLNFGFETGNLQDWTAEGDAFAEQPAKGDTLHARYKYLRSRHAGDYWIGGNESRRDRVKGTLTSVPFKVTHPYASFLLGGCSIGANVAVELLPRDANTPFFRAGGHGIDELQPVAVDLTEYVGKEIVIRVVDGDDRPWGHVNFDDFRFHAAMPDFSPRYASMPTLEHGKTIDVLKLLDFDRDIRAGQGSWDEQRRFILSGPWLRTIELPLSALSAYDLALTVEGTPRVDEVYLILPIQGRRVGLVVDGWGKSASGLQLIDGKRANTEDPTQKSSTHAGAVLMDGRPNQIVCRVKPDSIAVECNGDTIINWSGDPGRFSVADGDPAGWTGVVVGGAGAGYRFSKIELTPITLQAPDKAKLAAAPEAPKPADPTPKSAPTSIPGFTAYDGQWSVKEGELSAPGGFGPKLVSDLPPFADGAVGVEVLFADRSPGNAGLLVRLENPEIGADNFDGYEISVDAAANNVRLARHRHDMQLFRDQSQLLPTGKWIALEVRLTGSTIEVLVDGKTAVRHEDNDRPLLKGGLGLRQWLREARYRNLWVNVDGRRRELPFGASAPTSPSGQNLAGDDTTKKAARGTQPTAKAIDLLADLDLPRDMVAGKWELHRGVLSTTSAFHNRIQSNFDVSNHYRLTAHVSRPSPNKGPASWLAIGLPVGKHQTLFVVDNDFVDLPYAGLHQLDGQPPWANEALRYAPPVRDGDPAVIVCTVFRERLTVDINGLTVVDWQGDPQRLIVGPEWAPRDAGRVYVGADCAASFSKLLLESLDATLPLYGQGEKLPLPSSQQLSRARAALKDQPAAKLGETPRQRMLALAEKRLRDSFFASDTPTRYLLLDAARKEAAGVGNIGLAFRAIDELARVFADDKHKLRVDTLTDVGKIAPALVDYDTVNTAVEEAAEANRYAEAQRFLSLGNKAALAAKNKEWTKWLSARKALLGKQQAGFSAVQAHLEKLRGAPDDAEANLAAGKYYCFLKRDWWRGLPYLARCGDAVLKALAARDLERPEAVSAQRQLAADWWAASQQETGDGKAATAGRAGYWYRRVYPILSEGEKADVRQLWRDADIVVHNSTAEPEFLSDLPEAKVIARGDWFRKERNGDHRPIVSQGRVFKHGITVHPPDNGFSAVSYELGKKASRLRLQAAIEDTMKDRSPPIVFQAFGDGKQLWASPPLRGDKVAQCDIDVSEVETLELRTICDGGNFGAWAVWLDPRVIWK